MTREFGTENVERRNKNSCLRLGLGLGLVLILSCDTWTKIIVTAQVSKTLAPETSTASVLIGRATVQNIFDDDWMNTPDPGDSSFGVFPAKIEPLGGCEVKVNSDVIGERVAGVYFRAAMDLEYCVRYDLDITTADGKRITAHGFLPDSFSIVSPRPGDSLGPGTVDAVWTHSDSCQTFLVGITPADSASTAVGWSDSRKDTFCTIPAAAFQDSLGNFVPGNYVLSVTAVNGGWKKSGWDLLLSGGNLSGALGTFGCALLARPVAFRVE